MKKENLYIYIYYANLMINWIKIEMKDGKVKGFKQKTMLQQ